MCGIAGIFSTPGTLSLQRALEAMVDTLVHRGPDDSGMVHDGSIGLAMRRLSIIGVENGHQPIASEDGDEQVVVNGEIYNFRELKRDLISRGHEFRTDSDAEVVVHLYQEIGEEFVRHLRGMFAVALWDGKRRQLILARDRTGQKPLYYFRQGECLVFASEIKAIHASGLVEKELNEEALHHYLAFGFVPGEETMFRNIMRVPAGAMICVRSGDFSIRKYWDYPEPNPRCGSKKEVVTRIRELVEEAVRLRLMSEVSLGAFLSGGIDSSVIVACMSKHLKSTFQTFGVGFGEDGDELPYARLVAEHFQTSHHEVRLHRCTAGLMREINWYCDEPASDPAAVPTFLLSRFASRHITVALTGEGGDEIFAGYRHYRKHLQLIELEQRIPFAAFLTGRVGKLEPLIESLGPRRLQKPVWLASLSGKERTRGWMSPFTDRDIALLVHDHVQGSWSDGVVERVLGSWSTRADPLTRLMLFDSKSTLADQLLMKVDKMTMASSLEARSPLLDHHLVEYVSSLPMNMKITGRGTKLALRWAFQDLLPPAILARRKQGFDVPLLRWLTHDLASEAESLLAEPSSPLAFRFDIKRVRRVWRTLQATRDWRLARQVWRLVNLALWLEMHWPDGPSKRSLDLSKCPISESPVEELVESRVFDFS